MEYEYQYTHLSNLDEIKYLGVLKNQFECNLSPSVGSFPKVLHKCIICFVVNKVNWAILCKA